MDDPMVEMEVHSDGSDKMEHEKTHSSQWVKMPWLETRRRRVGHDWRRGGIGIVLHKNKDFLKYSNTILFLQTKRLQL